MKKNEAYCCIYCGNALIRRIDYFSCNRCLARFEVINEIPVFVDKQRYWSSIPKDEMRELNNLSALTNWVDAAKEYKQERIVRHILHEERISFRRILPDTQRKIVLDIGSNWGAISIPLAKYVQELYAVDVSYEILEFLSIIVRQEGVDNVRVSLASAYKLPFPDDYFDVALMIGVLEWLGADYDFVVCRDYGKRMANTLINRHNPAKKQLEALRQVHRCLRPGGTILIGIENRIFFKYFFGWPDAHTAVPFSSLLPRSVANVYMRILKSKDYAEYTYSYFGYKKILNGIGFDDIHFYAALPTYREPQAIIPLWDCDSLKKYYEERELKGKRGARKFIPSIMLRLKIMKYFVPGFFILAKKR